LTFLNRIQGVGKITYRRSRLASAGSELLPFVMKLQTLPAPTQATADRPAAQPGAKPADIPAERPVSKTEDRQATSPLSPPAQ
jgi:hypothetical protein